MHILGISAWYHDAAAALVTDGRVVAAVQQERLSRRKHDADLPLEAMATCLRIGGVAPGELDAVAFYDKPVTTFDRLLRTHLQVAPRGFRRFHQAIPLWLREKLWVPYEIERGLRAIGHRMPKDLWIAEHHESHAASAFYPSPFERAAVLTFDGVGEWATTSVGLGDGRDLSIEWQLDFPHSIGLLYSAFTGFCGFRVNSGEYKLMGLAPYGEPTYVDRIWQLVDVREDGSFHLDLRYFDFLTGDRMTSSRFDDLFDGPPLALDAEPTRRELDLARSVQLVTEELVLGIARAAAQRTGATDACLAGGVALNCVSNARLLREGPFERIWVQPAAGDDGGALGAALLAWHRHAGGERHVDGVTDAMAGCRLGPAFSSEEIRRHLDDRALPHQHVPDRDELADLVAAHLEAGAVVGLFAGRMEYGPRALGGRSILADPRRADMQRTLNLRIKERESFRPFAPAVLEERAAEWFDVDRPMPYMTFVADVAASHRLDDGGGRGGDLLEWAARVRSDIPAVTHVDGSARVQTVSASQAPELHAILTAFERRTGCPVLINTSFNVRGEPIVCTPDDAYRCFLGTGIDVLVMEDVVLQRDEQPEAADLDGWRATLVAD